MKKVLSVVLALLMLCSLALIASAEPRRFSVIDDTYANATRTIVEADLGKMCIRDRFYRGSDYFMRKEGRRIRLFLMNAVHILSSQRIWCHPACRGGA